MSTFGASRDSETGQAVASLDDAERQHQKNVEFYKQGNRRWRCPFRYRGSRRESAVSGCGFFCLALEVKYHLYYLYLLASLCSNGHN